MYHTNTLLNILPITTLYNCVVVILFRINQLEKIARQQIIL